MNLKAGIPQQKKPSSPTAPTRKKIRIHLVKLARDRKHDRKSPQKVAFGKAEGTSLCFREI